MANNYKIISETDFQKARNKIRQERKSNSSIKIVFFSDNDELNRKILEKEKIDVLLLKLGNRRDKIKQRDSGFNHVLAKLAKKKNVMVGINFDEIASLEIDKKERAKILARLIQNIKLCKKNRLNTVFVSESGKHKIDIYGVKCLGLVLGMPTWMIKEL